MRSMRRSLVGASLVTVLLLTSAATIAVAGTGPRPDGLIVFSCSGCGGTGAEGIFTIRPDGRRFRNVPGTHGDAEPAWSPDGRFLAVTRTDGIWLRASDGSLARRLTERHPQGYDASPSWSSDGKRVVFARGTPKRGGGMRRGLWIVRMAGRRPSPLLLGPDGAGAPEWSIGNPDWSPDGQRIAFGFGSERLMVIRADGTGLRRLGPPGLQGRDPHWSPDGRRIAFLEFSEDGSCRTCRPHRFRILELASGHVRTVFTSRGDVWDQSWSPDGRSLAIAATKRVECEVVVLDDECERLDLWNVDSRSARRTLIRSFKQSGGDVTGIDWRAR
jgi:Tol biopolymer transport system component